MSDVHSATCVRCGRAGGIRVEYQIGAATTIDFVRRRKHDSCDRAAKNLARLGGRNSVVECQLPKLDVAGSTPVARSREFEELALCRYEPRAGGGSLLALG